MRRFARIPRLMLAVKRPRPRHFRAIWGCPVFGGAFTRRQQAHAPFGLLNQPRFHQTPDRAFEGFFAHMQVTLNRAGVAVVI